MSTDLFVNVSASSIAKALVRSLTDMSPIAFPQLVLGDGRAYNLYFVDGLGGFAAFSGSGAFIPYIAIGNCGYPSSGPWTATFGANTTAPLALNISPAALQTALEGLASIGAGNVSVSGVAGKYYSVTFIGALANTNVAEITCDFSGLIPASTIEVSTIVVGGGGKNEVQLLTFALNPITFADDWTPIANGWTGELSTRTLETIQAFVTAGGTITDTFQITVADPLGVRTTYLKTPASIQCTIINPESFAGADKPLLATQAALDAAVMGANNFTREAATSAATGNTNVTPTATSRHHTAVLTVTGAAGSRTVSVLSTNSPSPGDAVLLVLQPAAVAGFIMAVFNASPAGTAIAQITSTGSSASYFILLTWDGSEWRRSFNDGRLLNKADNLAGLANAITSKANLRTLFGRLMVEQSADFTILAADDGKYIPVTGAGGNVVATLPLASDVDPGFLIAIQKSDGSAGVVTTNPATVTLSAQNQIVVLLSNGGSWLILLQSPGDTAVNEVVEDTNTTGNLVLTATAPNHIEKVTIGGAARTSVLILDTVAPPPGAVMKLRIEMPATAAIIIEVRDTDAAGTVLWTLNSSDGQMNVYVEAYWDGSAWKPLLNIAPVE